MIIRVNNDVILGLTTGHWSRQAWPQCDIFIDPTYHRFPYFRTGQIHNNREKVPTFVYTIVNIPAPRPLNNNACASELHIVQTRGLCTQPQPDHRSDGQLGIGSEFVS